MTAVSVENHRYPFQSVDLCLLSTNESKAARAYKPEDHLLYLALAFLSAKGWLSSNRLNSPTKQSEPFAPRHAVLYNSCKRSSQSPSNSSCILCHTPAILQSCSGCLLFLLPSPSHIDTHIEQRRCHFQKPSASSVAVGRFPSTGTSCRSPGRGVLVQQGSPRLVVRALLIRFSPLPYIILVYISGLCGSLHTNRHFNCILFVFSVLSQPLQLQSFSGTVFVFTYSHKL